MDEPSDSSPEDAIVLESTRTQMEHFRDADPPCRVMQLPEGILLRHTLSGALYFYLWTGVEDGKILTRIFASDSPYERKKTEIGQVRTPMFEPVADFRHLQKLERMLRDWVEFVKDEPDPTHTFASFPLGEQGN